MKKALNYLKNEKYNIFLFILTLILIEWSIKLEINYKFENIVNFLLDKDIKNLIIYTSLFVIFSLFFHLKKIVFLKSLSPKLVFMISFYLFGIYGLWKEWFIFNILFIPSYWIAYYFTFRNNEDLFVNNTHNKKNDHIYSSREAIKKSFLGIIKNKENQKSIILIDGVWGVGKSFFVSESLKEFRNPHIALNIDVNLFNNKNALMEHIFKELNNVLIDNGIRTKSLKKYSDILNETIDNKIISNIYSLVSHNETFEEIQENINDDIKILNKKIFIIIDNLERVLEDKKIIDILGFIHHLYEKLDLTILVLAHSSKLIEKGIEKEYLGKFFINDFYLPPGNYSEIIEEFFGEANVNEKVFFLRIFKNFESLINEIKNRLFWDEKSLKENLAQEEFTKWNLFNEFILNSLIKANERISLPRNLERIYHTHKMIINTYENFYNDKSFEEIFNEVSLFLSIYKIVFEETYIINIQNKSTIKNIEDKIYVRKDGSKELEKIMEENLALFHCYFSKVIEKLNLSKIHKELVEKTIFRFITNDVNEKNIIKNITSFLEDKIYNNLFNQVMKDFVYFSNYLDREEKSYEIYCRIIENLEGKKIKMDDDIDFKIFENSTLLEVDYKYALITKKSIFDSFTTIKSDFDRSHFNLFLSYIDTFEKIGKYFLNYSEEIRDYTPDEAFILKFKKDICTRKGIPDKEYRFDSIYELIVNSLLLEFYIESEDKEILRTLLRNTTKIHKNNINNISFKYEMQIEELSKKYNELLENNDDKVKLRKQINELIEKEFLELYDFFKGSQIILVGETEEKKVYSNYYNKQIIEYIDRINLPQCNYNYSLIKIYDMHKKDNNIAINTELIEKMLIIPNNWQFEIPNKKRLRAIFRFLNYLKNFMDKNLGRDNGVSPKEFEENPKVIKYHQLINTYAPLYEDMNSTIKESLDKIDSILQEYFSKYIVEILKKEREELITKYPVVKENINGFYQYISG